MTSGDPPVAGEGTQAGLVQRAGAFAVHLFTASGAAFALLALSAAVAHDWTAMFWWLGAAAAVDGADGAIARRLRVAAVLPRWSGESLDFVVDFVTYVFVPAYAIAESGLMPSGAALVAGVLVVVSGALYFADRKMKMADNCFRGFPALWNVAAFYLFIGKPDPWLGFGGVVVLVALTFAPFPFVHPLRVKRARALNIVLLVVGSLLAAAALGRDLDPGPWITAALCAIALYFLVKGLVPRFRSS